MTAPTSSGAPAIAATARRRRRWVLVVAVVALAAVVVAGWCLRPARTQPPLPAGIEDPEVKEAIDAARQPVLNEPGSAAAWGRLAKVLLAQLFDREADACFAEAARLDPTDPRWPYGRAVIALKRRPEGVPALLRQALDAAGANWPVYRSVINFRLAEALLDAGQLAEAEEYFRTAQAHDPGDRHAALGLGLIAQARGDDATARQLLTAAAESPYARKYATMQLAALARHRGDTATAAALEEEIARLPNDAAWPDPLMDEIADMRVGQRAFERRVRQLEGASQHAEAAELYLKRIEKKPAAELYVGAGFNLARLREYDRALPLLREAVRLEPDSAKAQYTLALVLFSRAEREWLTTPGSPALLEMFREARDHARRAAEIRPGHAKSYLFWGLSLKFLGQPEAAIAPLKMGLACAPSDLELQLGMGRALLDARRPNEAEPYLETARRLSPPNDLRAAEELERLRGKK
jgi:tetratricopeptide (TPR) repeat protein